MKSRLYLKTGDRVEHLSFAHWGKGEVVEEQHSMLPGGFCLVRIIFDDGVERSFINDLNNQSCCYYTGMKII